MAEVESASRLGEVGELVLVDCTTGPEVEVEAEAVSVTVALLVGNNDDEVSEGTIVASLVGDSVDTASEDMVAVVPDGPGLREVLDTSS